MKNLRYYMPYYWPIWILLFFLFLLSQLPYRTQLSLGKISGLLIMKMAKKSKRIASINLKLCFPHLSDHEHALLLRESFINIGIALFETTLAFWGREKRIRSLAHLHGHEHVVKALAEKKGVLLLGAHFTTIQIIGRIYAIHYGLAVMYRPHKMGIINFIIEKSLNKIYDAAIPRHDLRSMIHSLKEGKTIWYSADVNASRRASVFAPFFGVQAATVKAASRFAKLTKCAVIPVNHYRRDDGQGYEIIFSPPLDHFPTQDDVADATRINQIIETAVREHPAQYLWQYMRFKTRPEGEARIYSNPNSKK